MANFNRDLTVLLHMKNYCDEVIETLNFLEGDFSKFEENFVYRNSISMDIFQIGELANHLTTEFLTVTQNEINWHEIKGMKNRFAHGYFDMNHKVIFDTAIKDIPILNDFLTKKIDELS